MFSRNYLLSFPLRNAVYALENRDESKHRSPFRLSDQRPFAASQSPANITCAPRLRWICHYRRLGSLCIKGTSCLFHQENPRSLGCCRARLDLMTEQLQFVDHLQGAFSINRWPVAGPEAQSCERGPLKDATGQTRTAPPRVGKKIKTGSWQSS